MPADILTRHPANPILTAADIPGGANSVFNCGFVRHAGKIVGLQGGVWVSSSPDLIFWGRHRNIMESRRFSWDRGKIGPGAPPIKTDAGWLIIYHGTTPLCNNLVYRLGLAMLDAGDPTKVINRPARYLMTPTAEYERIGDTPNVCFACAAVPSEDGRDLLIYYGAADQSLCLATASLDALTDAALNWK